MLGFFHAYFSFFYSHQGKMGFGDTAQSTYAKLTISKSADKKFFSALNYEGIPVLKLGMDIIAMTLSVLRTLFFLFFFFLYWRYNPLRVCILQPSSGL